jgi:uridine kinase
MKEFEAIRIGSEFTIAINGNRGSGKTIILNKIKELLQEDFLVHYTSEHNTVESFTFIKNK